MMFENFAPLQRAHYGAPEAAPLGSVVPLQWFRQQLRRKGVPPFALVALLGAGLSTIGLVTAAAPVRCAFAGETCGITDGAPVLSTNAAPTTLDAALMSAAFALPASETTTNVALAEPAAPQTDTATVASPLTVRSGPSQSDLALFELEPGDEVTLLEWGVEWKRVSDAFGREGWVASSFGTSVPLTLEPLPQTAVAKAAAAQPAKVTPKRAAPAHHFRTVRSTGVTVRTGPDRGRHALFALEGGTRVTVLGESKGWLKVRDSRGRVGWAYSSYIGS